MELWRVRLWFDRVPLVAVGSLIEAICARGWVTASAPPGEWHVDFRRVYETEAELHAEISTLRALFGDCWSDVDWERITPIRQTP